MSILSTRATVRRLNDAKLVATAIAGNQVRRAIEKNISAPPVGGSPQSHKAFLSANDHPYARRHGTIQYRAVGGLPGFSAPEDVVHSVSGAMRNALIGRVDRNGPTYNIAIDLTRAPHAKYVIEGTRVLLPRDVLGSTARDPRVIDQIRRTWIRVLGPVFRTQSIVRIRP